MEQMEQIKQKQIKQIKLIHVLATTVRRTGAGKMLWGFLAFLLVCAAVIWLWEPSIDSYWDGIWYCYAVVTTIGFGDLLVSTILGRVLSIILSVYAALVIAIVTGVVVNVYTQIVKLREQGSLAAFLDKLEHLPELSREELTELSEQVKQWKPEGGK